MSTDNKSSSSGADSKDSSSGSDNKGSSSGSDYCYQTGYDHAYNDSPKDGTDIVTQAAEVAPCLSEQGSKSYGEGYTDGVAARDGKK